jgi:radical SAM-linked protein
MAFDKVRIRFRKDGDLRLVSHHDLMRTFERMLRRAALPVSNTSGFHPKPRLIFALSLPLGVAGCGEVAELELKDAVEPADILERLNGQAPAGLEILTVERINPKAGAQVRRAGYRIALPSGRAAELPERIAALLSADECWVERTRPQHRRYNLRPYLDQLRLEPDALEMDLLVTPTGTARAEEVLQLLGLDDLLVSGLILQRTRLELHDETSNLDSLPVPVPVPVPDSFEESGTDTVRGTGADHSHSQDFE